jgi:hypothetical protein
MHSLLSTRIILHAREAAYLADPLEILLPIAFNTGLSDHAANGCRQSQTTSFLDRILELGTSQIL